PWARGLCFAEWDLSPHTVDQLPHLLAVLIQGQIEASGARGTGNIRTPFSRQQLLRTLTETGWRPVSDDTVDTTGLQDADWEVNECRRMLSDESRMATLPSAVRDFVMSQADVLDAVAATRANRPLPAWSVTARRT
ncbi:MAG TPA: hypothetical protein VH333_13915, partial [Pseudonocardiaceae bacterium]|nr:hypothetical protein [Pseudonocardiaceae bacterium]